MTKALSFALFFACSCGSDSSGSPSGSSGGSGNGACPDLSGSWTVSQHCDATLVGKSAVATQNGCSLTFASPFNGFTGTIAADGTVTLSGPQSCTGMPSGNTISLTCTPGTCAVTLTK